MEKGVSYIVPPSQCHYLPDREWQLEYRIEPTLNKSSYLQLLKSGWRRFGWMLFRPRCANCVACQPLRVLTDAFQPDRSQRRVQKANQDIRLVIGEPQIDDERMDLYYRHHQHHADTKGWPDPSEENAVSHIESIVEGPFPVEEWAYYIEDELVAISYIDALADGLSGIYFYHAPEHRKRSLGTWICLSLIEQAAVNKLPYVYLGYYIEDCRSMAYKGRFGPHEILSPTTGLWKVPEH